MSDTESERTISIPPPVPGEPVAIAERDPDVLPAGVTIGAYVIQSLIASGGGGTVFLAEDKVLGRKVAIKTLRAEIASSPVAFARFLREVRVMNMIRHPAVVDIHELGELPDGRPYFVMELLEGSDLKRLIASRGHFPPEEVLEIVTPVCSALSAAHAAGVIHRDLKASNVNVAMKDGRYIVKLLDFGIAKLIDPDPETPGLTRAGTRLGTATAMAPEQIRGEPVDPRTDVYALGILIYHMLTGRYPFRGGTMQETDRLSLEAPPPRPSQLVAVAAAVDAVVLRCMDKSPARRYESAKAVEEALRRAVVGSVPPVKPLCRQAVAVYVEAVSGDGADESDEAYLDDLVQVLDATEQALQKAGLAVLLHTATSMLSARVLPEDAALAEEERRKVTESALALSRQLAAREGAHHGLRVDIRIHVDAAEVRGSSPAVVGGAIVEVASWPASTLLA